MVRSKKPTKMAVHTEKPKGVNRSAYPKRAIRTVRLFFQFTPFKGDLHTIPLLCFKTPSVKPMREQRHRVIPTRKGRKPTPGVPSVLSLYLREEMQIIIPKVNQIAELT